MVCPGWRSCPGYPLLHNTSPQNCTLLPDSVGQGFRQTIAGITCLCSAKSEAPDGKTNSWGGWTSGSAGTPEQSAWTRPVHVVWAPSQHGSLRLVVFLTSYLVAQGSKHKCSTNRTEAAWSSLTLRDFHHSLWGEVVTNLSRFKGRGHRPHVSMGRVLKNAWTYFQITTLALSGPAAW